MVCGPLASEENMYRHWSTKLPHTMDCHGNHVISRDSNVVICFFVGFVRRETLYNTFWLSSLKEITLGCKVGIIILEGIFV